MKDAHAHDWAIPLWEESWSYIKSVVDTVTEPFLILDDQFKVIVTNSPLQRLIGMSKCDIEGSSFYALADGQWDQPDLHILLEETLPKNSFFKNYTVLHVIPGNGKRILSFNARHIYKSDGLSTMSQPTILLAIKDITNQKNRSKKSNT